ncbi:MAG: toprim domain-containing protein, partial [Armatimonadota bacterium]|nr:toprim domain-containing protein [Armatimonadota bacterium]
SSGAGMAPAVDERNRNRLLALCAEAARFYADQLLTDAAETARTYLRTREIDRSCATTFGLGFAPGTPDTLYRRLIELGYTMDETEEAGLCSRGEFGPYDRMRLRLIIPVADAQGRVIAFGGRALGDGTPKYLNTPETVLFHKSRTLYLLDRARKSIQKGNTVVVVEGYLDALMAHHYGIENVVATLGTAITTQHVQLLQR